MSLLLGIKHFAVLTVLIFICTASATAQGRHAAPNAVDTGVQLQVSGALPKSISEASGLERTASGILWTHNDDTMPVLYGLDTMGNVIRTIHLNHPNNGWEDLALDHHGNMYVGAFGNNNNDRTNLSILKIADPENVTETILNADVIAYEYMDQYEFPPPEADRNFDADAMVCVNDSLYIFTKNRTNPFTGYTNIYRLPTTPGKYKAILHDSIYLGVGPMMANWVTSADISPDGKHLVLLSHDCLWIVSNFEGHLFSSGKISKIKLNSFSHKTGLCFVSDRRMFIVDELELGFLGGKLYALDLGNFFEATRQTKNSP